MTVFTLGPNENKDGPFAEVHARHEIDARRKVQSVDDRATGSISTPYIGPTATRYIAAGELRIFEKFEDLPPA